MSTDFNAGAAAAANQFGGAARPMPSARYILPNFEERSSEARRGGKEC